MYTATISTACSKYLTFEPNYPKNNSPHDLEDFAETAFQELVPHQLLHAQTIAPHIWVP